MPCDTMEGFGPYETPRVAVPPDKLSKQLNFSQDQRSFNVDSRNADATGHDYQV